MDLSYRTANIDFEQELVFLPQRSGLDDALVICGTYYTDMEYPTGRFISIWERKNRSFWNELFGAKESYEIVFIRACEDQNNNSYTLMCQRCYFEDVNSMLSCYKNSMTKNDMLLILGAGDLYYTVKEKLS